MKGNDLREKILGKERNPFLCALYLFSFFFFFSSSLSLPKILSCRSLYILYIL